MAQLMPLPLTVSCFSKIQIGFTFLVLAHLGSPGERAVKRVCVCVSDDSHDNEMSVEKRQSEVFTDAAAAAVADINDHDDNEYFEDVSSSVPSLSELRQQIVGAIGESLFSRVYSVVQVL